jgi:hypothetical protein
MLAATRGYGQGRAGQFRRAHGLSSNRWKGVGDLAARSGSCSLGGGFFVFVLIVELAA